MQPKVVITTALLLFVVASVGYVVVGEFRKAEPAKPPEDAVQPPSSPQPVAESASGAGERQSVLLYYFHRNQRCATCMAIEENAGQAVREQFAQEIKDGVLSWRVRNIDQAENDHFVNDFELAMNSLVLAEERDGKVVRWVNLDRIWEYAGEPERLQAYVVEETRRFLKGSDE